MIGHSITVVVVTPGVGEFDSPVAVSLVAPFASGLEAVSRTTVLFGVVGLALTALACDPSRRFADR